MTSSNLQSIFDSDDDGLLDVPEKAARVTASDRLESSFLEIVDFYRQHAQVPRSDTHDIAERKLGARLDGILADDDKVAALTHLDEFHMLVAPDPPQSIDELLDSDDLDLLEDTTGILDTSGLPSRAQRTEPDEVAQRVKSTDFAAFEPLFKQKHDEITSGASKLVEFPGEKYVKEGAFFVLAGVMAFVAEVREPETNAAGMPKERLRCIFENGTESSMYRRSLAARLYEARRKNEGAYVVVPAEVDSILENDEHTGYIYIVRSLSDDPQIASITDLYKIGFTTGTVEKRIIHAVDQPTYLMAPVEIVASYRTYNLKTSVLEHLLHRVFSEVKLNVEQVGKNGRVYVPSEWYVAPLEAIDEAIDLIGSGDIVNYEYNAEQCRLKQR
ncbi:MULTISPECIES: GIY-YIG nuclease family protein [Rhodococcus]|uniref:GIY-YIG nuclease family protein n=1 Tax=Rhodococcus TaxID=1827 RepID=UPI001877AB88|nr:MULTISPECIES: GIY-YIG nuclease family protein [Rhodococcus]MDI9960794.1 GIY-YIG nuclease family protein [Rhodococcus sp. IEGM 1237]MDI9966804.1 GIY-YIG nuclease family protein [Rhodococcus sp. IEGM 1251]MDV8129270.1 GIY-YIG nuclease family protein [Rhodococcus sp. IEGM 1304]QOS60648.1 GIY-YIG nuclease family protein [Rhodococcus qingshengii]